MGFNILKLPETHMWIKSVKEKEEEKKVGYQVNRVPENFWSKIMQCNWQLPWSSTTTDHCSVNIGANTDKE